MSKITFAPTPPYPSSHPIHNTHPHTQATISSLPPQPPCPSSHPSHRIQPSIKPPPVSNIHARSQLMHSPARASTQTDRFTLWPHTGTPHTSAELPPTPFPHPTHIFPLHTTPIPSPRLRPRTCTDTARAHTSRCCRVAAAASRRRRGGPGFAAARHRHRHRARGADAQAPARRACASSRLACLALVAPPAGRGVDRRVVLTCSLCQAPRTRLASQQPCTMHLPQRQQHPSSIHHQICSKTSGKTVAQIQRPCISAHVPYCHAHSVIWAMGICKIRLFLHAWCFSYGDLLWFKHVRRHTLWGFESPYGVSASKIMAA
eukprot:350142-Chlamydomonas_euryale.AAC.2